jgi:hypothetical protein
VARHTRVDARFAELLAMLRAPVPLSSAGRDRRTRPAGVVLAILLLTTIGTRRAGRPSASTCCRDGLRRSPAKLPPGAAVEAIDRFGYVGGSQAGAAIAVLVVWVVACLALIVLRPLVSAR